MHDLTQQGIDAFKSGDNETARKILTEAVKQNSDSDRAWGWLYNACASDEECFQCLRQIVRINPQNKKADEAFNELLVRFQQTNGKTLADADFSEGLHSRLKEQGVESTIRWLTSEDSKVCPICGPADNKFKDEPIIDEQGGWIGQSWGQRFGSPPACPNCRCKTVVERV